MKNKSDNSFQYVKTLNLKPEYCLVPDPNDSKPESGTVYVQSKHVKEEVKNKKAAKKEERKN